MYIRPEQILEQYEVEVKSVVKGRNCFLCETNQGLKALKEYRGSKEKALFLYRMLQFLETQNLVVEQICLTKEGEPFATDEEEQKYLLISAFRGAECETKNREDMLFAVKLLAGLHNASEKYEGEVPEFVKADLDTPLLVYEKHNRELRQVRNYIRSRKQKNVFEEMFVKEYDYFFEKAKEVTEHLKEIGMEESFVGFGHGDFNQHNVIFSKEGTAIVHFENFSYQVRVADLANFIRKMMEKNNWNITLGSDLADAYASVRPLAQKEWVCLYDYLAYPEKFWKIANHYNQSHKAWLSARNIEKLQKVTAQEEAKKQFLTAFGRKIHFLEEKRM